MQELTVKWYPNSATLFLELLRDLDWNTAARQLKKEQAAAKTRGRE